MSHLSVKRSIRKKPSHTRTRPQHPMEEMDYSDPDTPGLPGPISTMSYARTRRPLDMDSDDETALGTVLGSHIGSHLSGAASHLSGGGGSQIGGERSRRGTGESERERRDRERWEWERERERERQRELERERDRPRDRSARPRRDSERSHWEHRDSRSQHDRPRERERERERNRDREYNRRTRDSSRRSPSRRRTHSRPPSPLAPPPQPPATHPNDPTALTVHTAPYPDDDAPYPDYEQPYSPPIMSPPPFVVPAGMAPAVTQGGTSGGYGQEQGAGQGNGNGYHHASSYYPVDGHPGYPTNPYPPVQGEWAQYQELPPALPERPVSVNSVAPPVVQYTAASEPAPPLPARPPSQHSHRGRSRTPSPVRNPREHSRPRDTSKLRAASQAREASRRRSSTGTRPILKDPSASKNKIPNESAIYSSEDDRSRPTAKTPRLSVLVPSTSPHHRSRRASTASMGRTSGQSLLGDDLPSSRRGRSHSRARSEIITPTEKLSLLSIPDVERRSGRRNSNVSLVAPSPMLEPYRGTWQEASPMPSPILRNGHRQSEEAIPEFTLSGENLIPEPPRRARFHDSTDSTMRIARALQDETRKPDVAPLIEILPGLTPEQVTELRREYRKMVTVGAEKQGVNVAKHIKSRLKDCEPNLAKACYVVALGPWGSEANWANYWYHSDKNRRELLIEALFGRTNSEIDKIKHEFRDKRYGNSLVRCMKAELKEDKFKKAVLMVLEEGRQEEFDSHGKPAQIDMEQVDKDVKNLRKYIKAERGGETKMLAICVKRSDPHLRIVMHEYDAQYRGNLAREALEKCGNLVGEVMAHILYGLVNKPVRDAKLLRHSLTVLTTDPLRNDLLTSRIVRMHWNRRHLADVKRAFVGLYGIELMEAVRGSTVGEYGQMVHELCISRTPDATHIIQRHSDLVERE